MTEQEKKKSYSIKEATWGADKVVQCANIKCNRYIVKDKPFCWDALKDLDYCEQCGTCLRYMRKKADERGESIDGVELE